MRAAFLELFRISAPRRQRERNGQRQTLHKKLARVVFVRKYTEETAHAGFVAEIFFCQIIRPTQKAKHGKQNRIQHEHPNQPRPNATGTQSAPEGAKHEPRASENANLPQRVHSETAIHPERCDDSVRQPRHAILKITDMPPAFFRKKNLKARVEMLTKHQCRQSNADPEPGKTQKPSAVILSDFPRAVPKRKRNQRGQKCRSRQCDGNNRRNRRHAGNVPQR